MAGGELYIVLYRPLFFLLKIGIYKKLVPRPSEKKNWRLSQVIVLKYKDGEKPEKLDPKAKSQYGALCKISL